MTWLNRKPGRSSGQQAPGYLCRDTPNHSPQWGSQCQTPCPRIRKVYFCIGITSVQGDPITPESHTRSTGNTAKQKRVMNQKN